MTTRLNFEARHTAGLLDGSKPFTLRRMRGGRHLRLNSPLELAVGTSKKAELIATAECSFRALVHITADGVLRVLLPVFTGDGERCWRMFQQAEQGMPQAAEHCEKLAQADGFASWSELVAWHTRYARPNAWGALVREAIGFSGVTLKLAKAA